MTTDRLLIYYKQFRTGLAKLSFTSVFDPVFLLLHYFNSSFFCCTVQVVDLYSATCVLISKLNKILNFLKLFFFETFKCRYILLYSHPCKRIILWQ